MAPPAKVRCREIDERDLSAVVDLLMRGFPGRPRHYWERGLKRLAERSVPPGGSRFGYLLEAAGVPVGIVLMLWSTAGVGDGAAARCNLSSWYVEPAFRSLATLLISRALARKHVTYTNVSAARHTWSTVEALGFERYCSGQFFAIPALSPAAPGARVREISASGGFPQDLPLPERDLLAAHAALGCLSLVCTAPDGPHPFVFTPFRVWKGRLPLPCMHLVYCRDVSEFVRFAGSLGRHLLRYRMPSVILDANGPVKGLAGLYLEIRGRKYFKGLNPPRLGDLADTELAVFGP